jgi:hypothetical protein
MPFKPPYRPFNPPVYVPIIYTGTHNKDDRIYKECISDKWNNAYIFFAENEEPINVYTIKTYWLASHDGLIRKSLIKDGMHIFSSNPLEPCDYIQNKDYDWKHDTVLYKGNRTDALNVAAKRATDSSTATEWILIFGFIWIPIALALIGFIFKIILEALGITSSKKQKAEVGTPNGNSTNVEYRV